MGRGAYVFVYFPGFVEFSKVGSLPPCSFEIRCFFSALSSSPYRAAGPELYRIWERSRSLMECNYTNKGSLMAVPITEALANYWLTD